MRKTIIIFCFLMMGYFLFSQQAFKEVSMVVNVEVPVRVFDGKSFVGSLTMDDFEVYEDGVPQKIEAVYLIDKRDIERQEERKKFTPETTRNFFLFFEMNTYVPRINEAVDYFIDNVLLPQDVLYVITPMKSYKMRERVFEIKTKEDIRDEFKKLIRKEISSGSSEYNSIIRDVEGTAKALAAVADPRTASRTEEPDATGRTGDAQSTDNALRDPQTAQIEELCMAYATCISRLENLRNVDQLKLLDFAKFLKNKEGQKCVFLFYQREFIPRLDPNILSMALAKYQDKNPDDFSLQYTLASVQKLSTREIAFDVDLVKRAYADASVSIHFLFISKPAEQTFGIRMEEESDDIYGAFREMARASGGFVDSSSNPLFLFRQAVEASETYYLLYYSPKNYKVDGKFRNIQVKVKDKDYRIIHRAGYFAN
jgi:hypothetical protein